jgi:putative heme-binding domain-containing protein
MNHRFTFSRRIVLFGLVLILPLAAIAQEDASKKTFFLPKSPIAAAYVLGRLSNKELAEAPRGEFVYVAILRRPGLDRKYRTEALQGLADLHKSSPIAELVNVIGELDKKGDDSLPVLRDLSIILSQTKPESLAPIRAALETLANEAQLPFTRQMAYASILTVDGSGDKAWAATESDPKKVADLISSLEFVRSPMLRAAFYPKIQPLLTKSDAPEVQRAAIGAISLMSDHETMLYDKQLLVVEAGKPVEIILQNDDSMPHNLVVVSPGSVEEIGTIAEKMPSDPDPEGRVYIPVSPKILHATKLVDPSQKTKLSFTAPTEPGDYPYLCTFPGHWRRMVGNMAVVKDVDAYIASHAGTEPKITEWNLEDLAPDLNKVGFGRNLEAGKGLFTTLGCAQCHKLGGEGVDYGPQLTDVFKRYNNDRAQVLRQILEPSLIISNRYRTIEFEMKDGEPILGMILKEDPQTVTIQTGPSDALIRALKVSEIKGRQPQKSSVMPIGLLNTLSKDLIFDLLAYLEAGGKIEPHQHQH